METTRYRIASIDILRGSVMIIMALDHTRDYFHITAMTANPLDEITTTVPLFFTRWITHFCAPAFVFLSGLSAFLSLAKKTKGEASGFLVKRGLWLIVVEITLITFGLTFNPGYNLIILQVIWAIGSSMIFLGIFSRLSYKLVFIAGLILVAGHNALDHATLPTSGAAGNLLTLFLTSRGAVIPLGGTHLLGSFYAALPWTGIMFLGFSMGTWFTQAFDKNKRKRLLLFTGTGLIFIFIITRLLQGYGDPVPWVNGTHAFLSFLNTTKYPPSLQYTCMTIGPSLILLALLENIQAGWSRVASTYGRVPFYYYILHFYILHTTLAIVFFASGYGTADIVPANTPFFFRPSAFGYGLPVVYAIWLLLVAFLYLPCRWYDHYKRSHSHWWLSYL